MQIVRFVAPYKLDHVFNKRGDYDRIEMTISREELGAPESRTLRLLDSSLTCSKDIAPGDEAELFEIFFQQNALRLEGARKGDSEL
jgi:hypothetical protein